MSLGEFRDKQVRKTGTSWRSKLHSECDYHQKLQEILAIPNELERCIRLYDIVELKTWIYNNCIEGID